MGECKLTELEPEWWIPRGDDATPGGVMFNCPVCAVPGHSILVPWRGSPFVNRATWTLEGPADLEVLTVSPSVNLDVPGGGCKFHGWIQNGMVRW